MIIDKCILTAAEVAAALGCSANTVYKLLATGELHGYKYSGHNAWQIPSMEVEAFARRQMEEMAKNMK